MPFSEITFRPNYIHSYVIPLREYRYKYCPILATKAPTYVSLLTNVLSLDLQLNAILLKALLDKISLFRLSQFPTILTLLRMVH